MAQAQLSTSELPPPAWQDAPFVPHALPPQPGLMPYDPHNVALRYELLQVEEQLARLRSQRPRIFWPITIVAVGGAVAVFNGVMGLALWSSSHHQRYRWDQQGNRHEYTYMDPDDRAAAQDAAIVTAIGLAVAAGGLLLLLPRVKARREQKQEMRDLQQRRQQLIRQVSYSFLTGSQFTNLTVRLQF